MNQENIKANNCHTYSDVYESCSECGKNMYKASQIFIDKTTDKYICRHCKDKYGIEAVRCRDLD